jgi:hypothetical protein
VVKITYAPHAFPLFLESMDRDVVDYSPKCMGAIYFSTVICGLESKRLKRSRDFCNI